MEWRDLNTPRDLKEIQQAYPGTLHKEDNKLSIANWPGVVVVDTRWETLESREKEYEALKNLTLFFKIPESWDEFDRRMFKILLTDLENDALDLDTLAYLLEIFPFEQKTNRDDNCVPDWNDCALESIVSDTELESIKKENGALKNMLRCREIPKSWYDLYRRMFKMQVKGICQAIRIMIVLCMSIVSNCGKKTRLKNRYEKVLILILWRCGDIESNPGPRIADITRDFCKKMISLLVIKYWERKEGGELSQADYKRKPAKWPKHVDFEDPSTLRKETRNTMLRHLLETCLEEAVKVPNQWLTLTEKYQTLLSNGCTKSQKTQYADDLYSWLCQLRTFETADQLFERLSDITDQERNCVLEHMFKKMKRYVPDLTSKSIQSRRIAHESTISQMSHEIRETATENVLVEKGISECAEPVGLFIDVGDNGKAEIPEALRDACYNTSNAGGSNNFSQETHTSSITNFGDFEKADNNTVTWKIDVTNYNKGSKRKLDLTGYQGQHIPSKRQSTSPESNVLLLTNRENDALDEDRETTLADLMKIVQSELKTNLDDSCVPDWNDCAQESIVSDTETSALMQELDGYLSDEFIYELTKRDSPPSGIANI